MFARTARADDDEPVRFTARLRLRARLWCRLPPAWVMPGGGAFRKPEVPVRRHWVLSSAITPFDAWRVGSFDVRHRPFTSYQPIRAPTDH